MRQALQRQWSDLADRYCDKQGVNLLMAHLFMVQKGAAIPEEPEGEKPIRVGAASLVYPESVPESIQYVALGHLHRSQTIQIGKTQIAYSGSPLCYSFSESGQQKYVHLLEGMPGKPVQVSRQALQSGRQVLRATFRTVEKAVAWLKDHPDAYAEITLRTDAFLKASEIKRLQEANPFLLNIIPEPRQVESEEGENEKIDLSRPLEALFTDYFVLKTGQEPPAEIMDLLQEARQRKEQ
jgi:exonuclease SbcD